MKKTALIKSIDHVIGLFFLLFLVGCEGIQKLRDIDRPFAPTKLMWLRSKSSSINAETALSQCSTKNNPIYNEFTLEERLEVRDLCMLRKGFKYNPSVSGRFANICLFEPEREGVACKSYRGEITITPDLESGLDSNAVLKPEESASSKLPESPRGLPNRIRLFSQNGAKVTLSENTECIRSKSVESDITVGGTLATSFRMLFGDVHNTSIGIPETDITKETLSMGRFMSNIYYSEFFIPAYQPVVVNAVFETMPTSTKMNGKLYQSDGTRCQAAISFKPDEGQDYEVSYRWEDRDCSLKVHQIVQTDNIVKTIPVVVAPAYDCYDEFYDD